jgi:putative transposase
MHDTLSNGVIYRTNNVFTDDNRQGLSFSMDMYLTSKRVIRELDQLIAWRAKSK